MSDDERRAEDELREGYHKVDKREWLQEDEPAAEAAPEAEPAGAEPEPESELPQVDTTGLLRMCVGMFVEQAWVHLGLRLAPGAPDTAVNLPQAKLAIDTVAYMTGALGDNLSATEKRELEQVLASLRLNFVQKT